MSEWSDDEENLFDRLGFCGCGLPDEALKFIHDLLGWVDHRMNSKAPALQGEEWTNYCRMIDDGYDKVLADNKEGLRYMLFYFLDDKKITEHGGSVPGWILDTEFYDKLKQHIQEQNGKD
jgi:hypothetical protein